MMRELLIDSVCGRKRLAVIDNGMLCEMHYFRDSAESLAGNIYTGRVMNILPGMDAAFVDIGVGKNAFLHAGDIMADIRGDAALSEKMEGMSIARIVRPGQEIMVQVVREPGGSKGPRVSRHITIPGRMLVLLPTMKYIGVSRKIENEDARTRLQKFASELMRENGMGMIMRTAAENAELSELSEEYAELTEQWRHIEQRGKSLRAPALIHGGDTLEKSVSRDWISSADSVTTDSDEVFACLKRECPDSMEKIRKYSGTLPLFDVRGIDAEYEKACRHHVWLKNGGYLVIDKTEALTVIDVNTGKFTGKHSHEDTIFVTNCDAAHEIARQLRLRDIGGIIIVDFIDMADERRRDAIVEMLRQETSLDRIKVNVIGMTGLGLVEMTRKKKRLSVDKIMNHTCKVCGGSGEVEDFETIAWRIVYDLRRRNCSSHCQAYSVRLSKNVAGAIIAIGAPAGMKVHIDTADIPDGEYCIEPLGADQLKNGLKLLRTN